MYVYNTIKPINKTRSRRRSGEVAGGAAPPMIGIDHSKRVVEGAASAWLGTWNDIEKVGMAQLGTISRGDWHGVETTHDQTWNDIEKIGMAQTWNDIKKIGMAPSTKHSTHGRNYII